MQEENGRKRNIYENISEENTNEENDIFNSAMLEQNQVAADSEDLF